MNWKSLLRDVLTLDTQRILAGIDNRFGLQIRATQVFADRIIGAQIERRLLAKGSPNWQNIPVIINNFNRLNCLLILLDWLARAGMKNIIILDNASQYPPLLEFYKTSRIRVVHLGANLGYLALWKSEVFREVCNDFYVYTDPDVVPVDGCPMNAVEHFYHHLLSHPEVGKVGFGLKIDDLPAHFALSSKVVAWEQKYWREELEPNLYKAHIDTTFALYRPRARGGFWQPALRTGGDLLAQHLPWYADSANPDEEELFYKNLAQTGSSHWMT